VGEEVDFSEWEVRRLRTFRCRLFLFLTKKKKDNGYEIFVERERVIFFFCPGQNKKKLKSWSFFSKRSSEM
jgi:hypothetical protein